jgi:hypothetical protein
LPPRAPPALRELLAACLDRDPSARPAPAALAAALELLVDELPRRHVLGRFRVR